MKTDHTEPQVVTLLNALLLGIKIDRVMAYRYYGIADLRSRCSDVNRIYGIYPDRERVPNKKYLRYFIKPLTTLTGR
jgi:hypothetical protein